jgi:hypothetical protein
MKTPKTNWRISEEIDGTTVIYHKEIDPDDIAFGRAMPWCVFPKGTPMANIQHTIMCLDLANNKRRKNQ